MLQSSQKPVLTRDSVLINAGSEKVNYIEKEQGLKWNDSAEFPNCIGGFAKGYLYISGLSVINDSLDEIKTTFEV